MLILHFAYHKCLTKYYQKVILQMVQKYGWYYKHCGPSPQVFKEQLALTKKLPLRIIHLNNHRVLPSEPFKATHLIRDPRDMIVSGHRYHKTTKEPGIIRPQKSWEWLTAYRETLEQFIDPFPLPKKGVSYQEYLNQTPKEAGLAVEMVFRKQCNGGIDTMTSWTQKNPKVLCLRYEDIIGNEKESFRKIFTHYGFKAPQISYGVMLAEKNSLKSVKASNVHCKDGSLAQHKKHFDDSHRKLFEYLWPGLIKQLGY